MNLLPNLLFLRDVQWGAVWVGRVWEFVIPQRIGILLFGAALSSVWIPYIQGLAVLVHLCVLLLLNPHQSPVWGC